MISLDLSHLWHQFYSFKFPLLYQKRRNFSRSQSNRVERIGKLQKYPKYHCGMDAVKFALQRCEGMVINLCQCLLFENFFLEWNPFGSYLIVGGAIKSEIF